MDDSEKIKSISGIDDILVEEATEISLDSYSQLQLRLRSKKPNNQITLCYNPVSKANWVYKHFHEKGPPENCIVIQTTWKDNKFLPQEYINTLLEMQNTNLAYYKIYALGEFATLDKLIFPYTMWEVKDFNISTLKKSSEFQGVFGLDFGYTNDPSAFICSFVNLNTKTIYIFDEHYEKGMSNKDIAKMIENKGYSKEVITADSSEPKSIDELRKRGIYRIRAARKGKDSILNGIQFIQQFKLVIHPNCTQFKLELENYTWKKDKATGEYINTPCETFNHGIDGFRYSLEEIIRGMKKKIRATKRIV